MRHISFDIEEPYFFPISTILFSMGWFWLSFTFPLRLVSLHYNFFQIGAIGTSSSLPFILISYLYRKSRKQHLNMALRIPFIVMIIASVLLLLGLDNSGAYLLIIIFTGFFQSMWWISAEIETGLLEKDGMAEKYSAAWAIPTGLFPLFSGAMLQYVGFYSVYLLVLVVSIIGLILQPLDRKERPKRKAKMKLSYMMIVPMSFSGVGMGFIIFVLVPIIRTGNYSYFLIGILLTIYWVMFAAGSVVATFSGISEQKKFTILSSILSAFPVILLFGFNVPLLIIALSVSGFGSSMGFSKILSYINKTGSPRDGVFFYESFFSFGFVSGAFVGGVLAYFVSLKLSLIVFIPAILFAIFMMLSKSSDPVVLVSANLE